MEIARNTHHLSGKDTKPRQSNQRRIILHMRDESLEQWPSCVTYGAEKAVSGQFSKQSQAT